MIEGLIISIMLITSIFFIFKNIKKPGCHKCNCGNETE